LRNLAAPERHLARDQPFGVLRSVPYTVSVFSELLLDHFRNPRNAGDLPDATASVEVTNPVCGDILWLAVRIEQGHIVAARFRAQGCVTSIASSSVLTNLLAGKSAAEATGITAQDISDALGGLPPATFHAAQLCTDAVRALVDKISLSARL
jgi:nitrogen fixation protein NifU and related proteins